MQERLNSMSRFFQLSFVFLWTVSLLLLPISPAQAVTITAISNESGAEVLSIVPDPVNSEFSSPKTNPDPSCISVTDEDQYPFINNDFKITYNTNCNEKNSSAKLKDLGDGSNEKTTWSFDFAGLDFLDDEQIQKAVLTLKGVKRDGSSIEFSGNETLFIKSNESPLNSDAITAINPTTAPSEDADSCCYAQSSDQDGDGTKETIEFNLLYPYSSKKITGIIEELGALPLQYSDDLFITAASLELEVSGSIKIKPVD